MNLSVDRQYEARRQQIVRRGRIVYLLACIGLFMGALLLAALLAWLFPTRADARWRPEYAGSPYASWFESQRNAKGQVCCSESDGHPYFGAYTLNSDGSVTLHLKIGDKTLPKYMVLTGANPTGHAIWWYIDSSGSEGSIHTDFCFAPGTLT